MSERPQVDDAQTAEPVHIQIYALDDGTWDWDVQYDNAIFDQSGKAKSLDEAMECVRGVIENGRTKP